MPNQTQGLDRQLDNYLLSSSLREPEVLRQLQSQTASHQIFACDVNQEYTDIARQSCQAAGVANMIDLRIAPALETWDRLLANGKAQTFDFVFIDADRENYQGYKMRSLLRLRPGGLMAIDNVLWSGRYQEEVSDRHTQAIRSFN
ncbi:MAG: O-methyltransferase [Hormoscilla sp.]